MAGIDHVTIETPDPAGTQEFVEAAFGPAVPVRTRAANADTADTADTAGFRGFTLSLVVAQPSTVDAFVGSAVEAGATVLKPAKRSLWGYGGVVQGPDGTIWTLASSSKKDHGPATREVDEFVLQLGVADVAASKQFYVDHGLEVAKSYGRKYVQLGDASSPVVLALYGRRNLAKTAGVAPEGSGSHRLAVNGTAGTFTDLDGFTWEAAG